MVEPTKLGNGFHHALMGRDTPERAFAPDVRRLAQLAYPELVSNTSTTPDQKTVQNTLLNSIQV